MKVLAVTGHRPKGLKKVMKYRSVEDKLYNNYLLEMNKCICEAIEDGYNYFICGGAIGVDLDFAKFVLQYREKIKDFKKIKLEIAIPCKNQDLKWKDEDKKEYYIILSKADSLTIISENYTQSCMQKRNQYMVDKSSKIIVFWNGEKSGGTYNTYNYAKKQNKEIDIINLNKLNT